MKDHKIQGKKRKLLEQVVDQEVSEEQEVLEEDAHVQGHGHREQKQQKEGWADSMAKILRTNKPKNKKSLILSKAKKDNDIPKKPKLDDSKSSVGGQVEIVPVSKSISNVQDEDDNIDNDDDLKVKPEELEQDASTTVLSAKAQRKLELAHKRKLKEWEDLHRSKPDVVKDRVIERELVKIATKGVTQLFNAVSMQQKTMRNKLRQVGKSEFKKDKILGETKEIFEDFLEEEQEAF